MKFPRFYALFLSAVCAIAVAQTVTQNISLGWVAPTKNVDGSTITGTLTYNLYQGVLGGAFTQVASGLTGTSTVITSAATGNCFALGAVETQGITVTASALTSTVCAPIPGPASNLTVTVTVTVK